MNIFGFLATTMLLLFACEPEVIPGRVFVIKKNNHYATPRLTETLQSNKLSFEARFDDSAIYDLEDLALQSSKNKLLGFSDCNSAHHENSARFAWQWYNNRLEIYAYCYVNGERKEAFVGLAELNTFNQFEIELTKNNYVFRLNESNPVYMERQSKCETGVYYKLWPYFGGSVPAPHDIRVEIRPLF